MSDMTDLQFMVAIIKEKVAEAKIKWHPTTPRKFKCAPDCLCCCAINFFLPSEVKKLPRYVVKKLGIFCGKCKATSPVDGKYCKNCGMELTVGANCVYHAKPFNENFGCIFSNPRQRFHCTIHEYRPLRCKLYPFMPFLSGKNAEEIEIVILAEPFTNAFSKRNEPEWMRCYGLGQGESVQDEINRLSRTFLLKVCEEMPMFLTPLWRPEPVDSVIVKKYVEKHLNPKYKTWGQAKAEGLMK